MARLLKANAKATATPISICYNQDMQNSISEPTTPQTLKQMQQQKPTWCGLLLLHTRQLKKGPMTSEHTLTIIYKYGLNVLFSIT